VEEALEQREFVRPTEGVFASNDAFFWKLLSDYPRRPGKYLRPVFVLLSCEAAGGDWKSALPTAAALQLSSDALLIIDDVQDDAERRRGDLCLHRKHSAPVALTAAYGLLTLMWQRIHASQTSVTVAQALSDEITLMLMRTGAGQTADVRWQQAPILDFSIDDYYYLVDGKTGYYSCSGPLRLGAILAGVEDPDDLARLEDVGLELGRAYKIVDDVLDVTSDFAGRKVRGADIREGKPTLLLHHVLKHGGPATRRRVEAIFRKPPTERRDEDVSFVVDEMTRSGSIAFAMTAARSHGRRATEALDSVSSYRSGSAVDTLRMAIDYVCTRHY